MREPHLIVRRDGLEPILGSIRQEVLSGNGLQAGAGGILCVGNVRLHPTDPEDESNQACPALIRGISRIKFDEQDQNTFSHGMIAQNQDGRKIPLYPGNSRPAGAKVMRPPPTWEERERQPSPQGAMKGKKPSAMDSLVYKYNEKSKRPLPLRMFDLKGRL